MNVRMDRSTKWNIPSGRILILDLEWNFESASFPAVFFCHRVSSECHRFTCTSSINRQHPVISPKIFNVPPSFPDVLLCCPDHLLDRPPPLLLLLPRSFPVDLRAASYWKRDVLGGTTSSQHSANFLAALLAKCTFPRALVTAVYSWDLSLA